MKRVAIKKIIQSYLETRNYSQTAKDLSISRWTVMRWVKRGKTLSPRYIKGQGIERKSTKPHTVQTKLSREQQKEILLHVQEHHMGAKKVKYLLGLSSAPMTIHRLLKRKGLVKKQIRSLRPRFQNGKAMRPRNTTELGYLQMDTKHVTPELSGLGKTVYEFAAIDIVSRYKLAILLPDIGDDSASLALQYFLKWFPFKVTYVQTDNGSEFKGDFEKLCTKEGITHYFIHKNSPNENAVIERSFRTDQDEFYYWLEKQPQHIGELNTWLQAYLQKYNTYRPHQSLDYKTPLEIVQLLQMS